MSDESSFDRNPAADPQPVLALVTGGARRLGARFVRALAAEGFDVAFTYHRSGDAARRLVDELDRAGTEAGAYETDLRSTTAIEGLVDAVESDMGPIGLLVNNAGVLLSAGVDDSGPEDLDESIAVNLRAPYLLSLVAGRRMRDRGEGCIVNVASTGGLRPYRQHLSYSVSKAGLVMTTQALALAFAPHVTVNAVAPGVVHLEGEDDEDARPPAGRIPLGEYGDPDDVVDALLYLATAPYVTGQVLAVDGGFSLRG